MFTSMSDIGFPSNIHNYNLNVNKQRKANPNDELITTDKIQRIMDTQNNWRVRTKTIDELLHDIHDRIDSNPVYILVNSERLFDFFIQLLTDQNFKIVLNTLNILNMIVGMKQQLERHDKIAKKEITIEQVWGLSNPCLGRQIPLLVKKLADSKNIIRQEATRCLFSINEIMRSGPKKDNNFIALVLPYLNNSSNWHIREELLYLLIRCFLISSDPNDFDSFQILSSILQLFSDKKEKIRNLALEAVAAYSQVSHRQNILEILFQLSIEKEVIGLVRQRLDQGMFPFLNKEGGVEIPYFQNQVSNNFDVDSVALSMTNQTQISRDQADVTITRKKSVGSSSQKPSTQNNQFKANPSGRKILVATANATFQHLPVSTIEENQAFYQSKRITSDQNTNFDFDNMQSQQVGANFSYSAGGHTSHKYARHQVDNVHLNYDLNGSSFLPQLQKYTSNDQHQIPYDKNRVIGSSGVPSMGFIAMIPDGLDQSQIVEHKHHALFSGGNKRTTKYIHGTPGQTTTLPSQFSINGPNLQNQFSLGNSGKVMGNHKMKNSISIKSPSVYDNNTNMLEMSGNAASFLGGIDSHFAGNGLTEGSQYANLNNGKLGDYQQTPSSFNQDQVLFSAGGNRNRLGEIGYSFNQGIPDFDSTTNDAQDDINNSFNNKIQYPSSILNPNTIGVAGNQSEHIQLMSPSNNSSHINVQDNSEQHLGKSTKHIRQSSLANQQNRALAKQNTFYSDGTEMTGITVTTGATSQNKTAAQKISIVKLGVHGGQSHQIVLGQDGVGVIVDGQKLPAQAFKRKPGPIKATREALGNPPSDQMVGENVYQNLSQVVSKKQIKQKGPSSKQRKMEAEGEDGDLDSRRGQVNHQNRSFSYNQDTGNCSEEISEKENHSATLKKSGNLGESAADNPAMLNQTMKVSFLPIEELEPLSNPDVEFKKCLGKGLGVNSEEWQEQFDACNIIRRVCMHHQNLIIQTGNQLNAVVVVLLKLAESLRSAMARIALITLKDMFFTLKRVMEPCIDQVIKILLKKAADTNNFIAEEADKCLQVLVQNCQENKVLQVIQMQNLSSRSGTTRLKLCQCLLHIVKSLGNNILFFKDNDKLIVQLAKYLQDACQEVRLTAKNAFIAMSQAIMGQNELEKLLQRVLNEVQYKKVKDFMEKEPINTIQNQGSQVDFLITNASSSVSQVQSKKSITSRVTNSTKPNRQGSLQKQSQQNLQQETPQDQEPLNIQAKSILNPQQVARQESQAYLGKQGSKKNNKGSRTNICSGGDDLGSQHLQVTQLSDTIKDAIGKTNSKEWRSRLETVEFLFETLKQSEISQIKSYRSGEVGETICRLLQDTNTKVQTMALETFILQFHSVTRFVEQHQKLLIKSLGQNLSSPNPSVKKISEQLLRRISDEMGDSTGIMPMGENGSVRGPSGRGKQSQMESNK